MGGQGARRAPLRVHHWVLLRKATAQWPPHHELPPDAHWRRITDTHAKGRFDGFILVGRPAWAIHPLPEQLVLDPRFPSTDKAPSTLPPFSLLVAQPSIAMHALRAEARKYQLLLRPRLPGARCLNCEEPPLVSTADTLREACHPAAWVRKPTPTAKAFYTKPPRIHVSCAKMLTPIIPQTRRHLAFASLHPDASKATRRLFLNWKFPTRPWPNTVSISQKQRNLYLASPRAMKKAVAPVKI